MAVAICRGRQLESPKLNGHVRKALRSSRIAPATLIPEVTETILLVYPGPPWPSSRGAQGARRQAGHHRRLRHGYSSISYLRRFPVILKIDEFTDGADLSEGIKLLRGIAQLGRMVGLSDRRR